MGSRTWRLQFSSDDMFELMNSQKCVMVIAVEGWDE